MLLLPLFGSGIRDGCAHYSMPRSLTLLGALQHITCLLHYHHPAHICGHKKTELLGDQVCAWTDTWNKTQEGAHLEGYVDDGLKNIKIGRRWERRGWGGGREWRGWGGWGGWRVINFGIGRICGCELGIFL
jgi:hypothetical protein